MGLVFLAFGVGGLLGPPLGGVLADATEGPAIPIAFALATSVAAFACSLTMRTGAAEITA